VSETIPYINYFIAQQQKTGFRVERNTNNVRTLFPIAEDEKIVDSQRIAVEEFLEPRRYQAEVLESYIEIPDNRRTNKWPQLEKAIDACKLKSATLIIAELGTLTNNESFTQLLLDSGISFHCCDQPFVNQTILEALYKHAQVQRKKHGELIRQGLKMTTAKSGNPNAAEVISKVNKPKIDTAIVFAFLLQPIITDYKRKGYSQRQMVKTLNEEGFTAPEGGKWVLSQLQKVLDRVRLNEVTTETKTFLEEAETRDKTEEQLVEELNRRGVVSLKRSSWDVSQVNKLLARQEQIKDIELINRFVLDLLPIVHEYRRRNLSTLEMVQNFEKAGLPIKQSQGEVAA
jgi:hypothetical protein